MKAKLVVALALASLLLPTQPEVPLRTGAFVQDVTRTSAKVCWVGDRGEDVQLAVAPEGEGPPLPASHVAWLETGLRRVAHVTGLEPGRRYAFTVSVDGARQEDLCGSFRTPPDSTDATVRFVVLGDSGGLPWWVNVSRSPLFGALARLDLLPPASRVRAVGRLLEEAAPEFWLHTGDVVYPRGEQRHYGPGFFAPFAQTLRRAPVYPVVGNHDWEWTQGRPLLANFELPAAGPGGASGGDEQFFTFAWGPVRVVGLNLNRSVGIEPGIEYARRSLAAATEPWKIVVEHFPPWSASDQGDRLDLIERFVPVLQEAGVDVLLCGHDHTYQRFRPAGRLHLVVTGGGGKSLYELREHPRLVTAASVYHVCIVECDAHRFALRAVAIDGSEIDAFTLTK